jgi:hypothetical protein
MLDLVKMLNLERDWKEYKAFASKARAQLAPEKVKMLKVVVASLKIKSKNYDAWRVEMDKFGSMEHMTAIDVGLVRAQAIVVTLLGLREMLRLKILSKINMFICFFVATILMRFVESSMLSGARSYLGRIKLVLSITLSANWSLKMTRTIHATKIWSLT